MGVSRLPVYMGLASLAPIVMGISLWTIRGQPGRLRWWGMIAFAAVILQGVLGGLRVILFKDQIGIFHATLAQLFFVLTCAIALFTSRWWLSKENIESRTSNSDKSRAGAEHRIPAQHFRQVFLATTTLILFQLILGATI